MKDKTRFICQQCGYDSPKWLGRCPACNAWNTFSEEYVATAPQKSAVRAVLPKERVKKLSEIKTSEEVRVTTKIGELDRVLGGGIVPGSLILVGGDPGIGKSTLLLQICQSIQLAGGVLYVSGEESLHQIKLRADRLSITTDALSIVAETDLDAILAQAEVQKPGLMIIDSIQTMYKSDLSSPPGSVGQVRESTHSLMRFAKSTGTAVIIVGHVTKEGNIAGPRVLEHMVDCVLYFEGERHQSYRMLRTVKNRFGSTNEIGVFEMKDTGLCEVKNPSEMLISGRPENTPGSAVVCTLEGTRPVLAEVQALSSPTGFGNPRRMSTGLDYNRAVMLVAVLEKRVGYSMQNQDVYINVAGGLKVMETAIDLAVILAIASNYKNFVIDYGTILLGEVGLTGEVRAVSFVERRIRESKKMGFTRCIIPYDNLKGLTKIDGIDVVGVKTVADAIGLFYKKAVHAKKPTTDQEV